MSNFKNKNVVITGASRGIGLSIAKKLAKDGANIAILAKTDVPHSKLPGTIFTAAKEIEELGVKALPMISVPYSRVLLKLSGESFKGKLGYGLDPTAVGYMASQIAAVRNLDVELGVVVGGAEPFFMVTAYP